MLSSEFNSGWRRAFYKSYPLLLVIPDLYQHYWGRRGEGRKGVKVQFKKHPPAPCKNKFKTWWLFSDSDSYGRL